MNQTVSRISRLIWLVIFLIGGALFTFSAGCAHDSDDTQSHSHRHHGAGHREGQDGGFNPTPAPGSF